MTPSRPDVSFFVPSLGGGGAERVMVDLAQAVHATGRRVDLVVADLAGSVVEELSQGIRVVDLARSRVMAALPPLVRYLRRERPTAVLSTLDHANVVAVVAGRLAGGVRVVVRQANPVEQQLADTARKERVLRTLMRWSYLRSDAVVAVSEGVSRGLIETLHLPPERVHVIANPALTPRVFAGASSPITHPWFESGDVPVLLAVGRLVGEKGYDTLLRAFSMACTQSPCRLLILGEGPMRAQLARLVAELGVGDRVDMPGFVSNPFAYMARCSIYVLSSRSEGLPNALIQARALGARVVATDCPSGPREILEGGKLGALVPVDDVTALAHAIVDTLRTAASPVPDDWRRRYALPDVTAAYLALLGSAASVRQSGRGA